MSTNPSPQSHRPSRRRNARREFEIAIVCALPLEADVVEALFDQHWDNNGPPYDKAPGDPNAYTTGAIGRHSVVLAHMPSMGKANAAAVAANCRASFPNTKLAAVVGICGAVPFGPDGSEIVLGDVIISDGVVQYDIGRRHPDRFVRKDTLSDSLGRPTAEIRALLSKLKVIKGTCDYVDSHKTKSWQRYTAATAAACLKAFLEFWVPSLSFALEPRPVLKQPAGTWLPERPETPPHPSFMVPFRRDADFVERKSLFDWIHQTCLELALRVALVGLGGMGKSQLTIEHVYRIRDLCTQQNKQVWVFWVYAGTRVRVEEGFKAIADAVKIPGWNQPKADVF
ncbi:hypothetical protein E0Z10_g9595 [Xylaria hypoxylon]|uniref:Nucleoside phosphorylase domain-containing protein n=1 Tax=Xylaria hypoxylon TaxID=37992 RepID=A0A4Z0Y524_9PEZI|nr:hypothetical protein E0Z10_g9595 [Xylaria hypoxylon]